MPKVSICVPTYNNADEVKHLLESIYNDIVAVFEYHGMLSCGVFNGFVIILNIYLKKYFLFVTAVVKNTSAEYLYIIRVDSVYTSVNYSALIEIESLNRRTSRIM